MEHLVGHQTGDQADHQLQEKGLRRAGGIAGGQIGNGQTRSPGQAAPGIAQKQGAQHHKGVSQVEGRLIPAHGNVNAEKLEADIGQGRKQSRLGQLAYPLFFYCFLHDTLSFCPSRSRGSL